MKPGRAGAVALVALAAVTARAAEPTGPPADAVLADVSFEAPEAVNRVIVDLAKPGNRPLRMLLDTGATFSVMTPLFARSLGVTVRPLKRDPYRRATSLGRDLQFYVDTSSSDSGSQTGWEYGLLGGNFLMEYVVEFDFEGRRVRFLDPSKFEVPDSVDAADEVVLPLRIVSGRPFVKIEMNGKRIPVLIDTGAHDPMILSGRAAKKAGVDVDALPPFGQFGSVKGPVEVSLYETESFAFGPFAFDAMPVIVAPKGWYNQGGSTDSVIGYDVLSQFQVRIDYPRQRLWLRRVRDDVRFMNVGYAQTRDAGLFLYPAQDAYRVLGIVPDSPAARMGFEPGDRLTQRAGVAPPPLEQTLAKVRAGEPVRVARRSGDAWIDVVLPAGASLPDLAADDGDGLREVDREQLHDDARRRDAAARERFEQRKNAALYYQPEGGGWMRVPDHHRRRGPREGEQWFTFDEMQAIEAGGTGAGGDAE